MQINRGEIWLIDLNPVIGHEQAGIRPCIIISDDLYNHSFAEMVIILPITSKNKEIPTHISIDYDFLSIKSYIKTEDIRSVSIRRLVKKLGTADVKVMSLIEERIKLLLGFE